MKVVIPSPKHYEAHNGHSEHVRMFLNQIEEDLEKELYSSTINKIRISLYITPPELIDKGLFSDFMKFDWRIGYAAIGLNGDYGKYHNGNDYEKITVINSMLILAFTTLGKKKRAEIDFQKAIRCINSIYENWEACE